MKTIKELREEGLISTRTYNCIRREAAFVLSRTMGYRSSDWDNAVTDREILDLTVRDLLDLLSDKKLMIIRGFGAKSLNELKSLM